MAADIVIRNVSVFDGSGKPPFAADVAILGDRISAVGNLGHVTGHYEVDGTALALAPGFIDVHSHDDHAILVDPDMLCKISQGVTTVVAGNCGISLFPRVDRTPPPLDALGSREAFRFETFSDYVAAVEANPPTLNAALMIGHQTLRVAVMSELNRAATMPEIDTMRAHIRNAVADGAIGFSTGLYYPPSNAAPPDEVSALLQELRGTGAVYATHMRDEADHVEESLEESFETAKSADVPVIISHHKCMGARNFGRSQQTLARIEAASKRQPIGLDAYPYTAGSTALLSKLIEDSSRIVISRSEPHPELVGRELADVAAEWGVALKEAIDRLQPGGGIYFIMDDADVERILSYPETMIGSDGIPQDEFPHPRLWGSFSRVLGHYARDRGLFAMEEAVRRMTSLSAERFGLADRGHIKEGAFADLVLFDPATIIDAATFAEPTRPTFGVQAVIVNGTIVLEGGRLTGARPGRVIRRAVAS